MDNLEEAKKDDNDQGSIGEIQPMGNTHTAHDDMILEHLRRQEHQLPSTYVRVRQQTCSFKDVNKDELPSFAKDFQPARRMTLQQMIKKDKTDISLENYKKSLLGNVNQEEISKQEPVEVEIVQIEVVCKDRPNGNISLNFQEQGEKKDNQMFMIKEGSVYFMRVHFKVRFDCVYGLKFVNNVWRHFVKVDKYEEMMGCFSPKQEIQTIDLMPEEAPSGIFGRGSYKGKIMFVDNDGIVHMQFEYNCKISKKWH